MGRRVAPVREERDRRTPPSHKPASPCGHPASRTASKAISSGKPAKNGGFFLSLGYAAAKLPVASRDTKRRKIRTTIVTDSHPGIATAKKRFRYGCHASVGTTTRSPVRADWSHERSGTTPFLIMRPPCFATSRTGRGRWTPALRACQRTDFADLTPNAALRKGCLPCRKIDR